MQSAKTRALWSLIFVACAGCGRTEGDNLTIRSADHPTGETPVVAAADWPTWRGPTGDGVARDAEVPTTWSTTEHIRWQTPVPGYAHSSPIVVGDRVFLTTADEEKQQHRLLAFDRQTGKPLWDLLVHDGGFMH